MPMSPPLPPLSTNAQITLANEFHPNYSTPTSVSVNMPNFNMPQPQVVTTPISLPGMPPITVSASVPQNPTFYSPVMQQNQMPGTNTVTSPTQ
jgi:hypothetical protein